MKTRNRGDAGARRTETGGKAKVRKKEWKNTMVSKTTKTTLLSILTTVREC